MTRPSSNDRWRTSRRTASSTTWTQRRTSWVSGWSDASVTVGWCQLCAGGRRTPRVVSSTAAPNARTPGTPSHWLCVRMGALAVDPCPGTAAELASRTGPRPGLQRRGPGRGPAVADRGPAPLVGMSLGGLTAIALRGVPAGGRPVGARRHHPGVDADKGCGRAPFIAGPQSFPTFGEIFERTVEFNPTRTPSRCVGHPPQRPPLRGRVLGWTTTGVPRRAPEAMPPALWRVCGGDLRLDRSLSAGPAAQPRGRRGGRRRAASSAPRRPRRRGRRRRSQRPGRPTDRAGGAAATRSPRA